MAKLFKNSLLQAHSRYQLLATLIVNIITFGHGFGVGWLSPTLTKIQTPDSPLDFKVNIDEISWMGSMLGLGALCGNLVIAVLLERAGRKWCIYLLAAPYACLWIFIYSASNIYFLYAARFLCGFTSGAAYVVVPIFISEVADSNIRGALTSMVMLSVDFGVLAGFVLSTYLSYYVVPILGLIVPVSYFIASLMLPETPPYLLKRSQLGAAEKSFRYYKNQRDGSSKEEFEELRTIVLAQQSNNPSGLSYKDLITKPALKGFSATAVLCTGFQFSGIFSFINYSSEIFERSGSVIDPNTCTIIIGVVQIIGVYTSTIFVDIVGRRLLMLLSSFGVGIGCIAFGLFTYLAQIYDLSDYHWLPLLLMVFILYVANAGLVGLFFLVIVEAFPSKIRSFGTSVSVILMSIMVFFTLKLFPLMLHFWGVPWTMWFSATSSLLTFTYFLFFLAETKGKSMVED